MSTFRQLVHCVDMFLCVNLYLKLNYVRLVQTLSNINSVYVSLNKIMLSFQRILLSFLLFTDSYNCIETTYLKRSLAFLSNSRTLFSAYRKHEYVKNYYIQMTSVPIITAGASKRMLGKLSTNSTAMLLCDVQERFQSEIYNMNSVVQNCRLLTSACKLLDVPIVITEQYPKAFGPTVEDCFKDPLDLKSGKYPVFPKTLFSMITPEVSDYLAQSEETKNVTSFLISGIETHVCVQQTALDLLEVCNDHFQKHLFSGIYVLTMWKI